VETRIAIKKASVEALNRWKAYLAYCTTHQIPPIPLTYDSVSGYLCHWVATHDGSTRTLAKVKSNVKVMATLQGHGWLTERHALQLRRLVGQLQFEDTSEARRVSALRTKQINEIISLWDLDDPVCLLEAALLKFGAQALLRGAELTSGLRPSDVVWIRGSKAVQLLLRRTKCGRTGAGVFVTVARCHDPLCGVRLLRRLWRQLDLDNHPQGFIFPAVAHSAIDTSRPYAAVALRRTIKRAVQQIGLDPRMYANHSLRAGGATDLLSAGVPDLFVKKAGRWKSDTYQIYHREGMVVALQAARGFSKATKSRPPRSAATATPAPAQR
jgi:integrase